RPLHRPTRSNSRGHGGQVRQGVARLPTRLRVVTPHRLFLCIVAALVSSKVETLADLEREFNHQTKSGTDTGTSYVDDARQYYQEEQRAQTAPLTRSRHCIGWSRSTRFDVQAYLRPGGLSTPTIHNKRQQRTQRRDICQICFGRWAI